MSTSPMKVSNEVKEKLEILKIQMRCSSLSDVVEELCKKKVQAEEFEREVRQQRLEDAERNKQESILLGEDRKSQVVQLREQLGIKSDACTIDFLLDVFYTSDKIDRSVFMNLVNLR